MYPAVPPLLTLRFLEMMIPSSSVSPFLSLNILNDLAVGVGAVGVEDDSDGSH